MLVLVPVNSDEMGCNGTGPRLWLSLTGRCCALAMFLTVSIASAQIYKFRVYGTEDGLRNLAILSMVQDRDGYVWAGTLNGLYRYDGDRFERMGAEHGFLQSQIVSLAVTPDGSIWAGTATGLAVFREHTFQEVHFAEAVTLESQSSLAVDPATGALWVATNTGLASIESSSYRRGSPKAVFASFAPHAIISAVSFGADGCIWFGSGGSLFQYERKSGVSTRFGSSVGVPNDIWDAILSDGEGRMWARSATRLISLRKGEKRFQADRLPTAEFGALALQRNGNVAIPTVKGLAIRDRNGWKVLGTKSGLPMDSVSSFFVDREGSPWIGTNGGGVARWLGFGAWENWTAPAWLEDEAIWSIAEDHSGDIWVGSNTGVMKMTQGGQAMQAPARNRLRFGDVVRSMAVGEANDLWVGTQHHGLFHCDLASEHCEPVGEESGLHSPSVSSLSLDSSGILWVASGDGVYFGNATERRIHFEPLHVDGLPPGQHPGTLVIGPHREVLTGTRRGLWISRDGTWTNIGRVQGLLNDDVNQVAADQVGNIYVTYRKPLGVSQIRLMPRGGVEIKHFTEQNEVRSNYIYTLGTDARNNLWSGTDSGIDRLAGGRWRHYGTANGLIWTDLNSNAFFADSRHGLRFGTSRGLAHYQPDLDTSASAAPQPLVTKVVVDGRTVDSGHPFVVPYRHRDVTMRFSALSFLDEIDTHFEYRVVGLLDDWRACTGRDLQLLKLPAGSYSLEVLATTPNNGKSPHPHALAIRRGNTLVADPHIPALVGAPHCIGDRRNLSVAHDAAAPRNGKTRTPRGTTDG
jgi:ligand-binding sensor domain-containing protein